MTFAATQDLLLPATVTGSWPRPQWYTQSLWGRPLDSAMLDPTYQEQFAEQLLHEERVAVIPGKAFGACGEGHVRCSYAASMEQLEEALHRIGMFVRRLGSGVRAPKEAGVAAGASVR